ncbi:MAG: WYL domain-containing protein [Cellulomonadaceae bacterium]|nr:WYL domain-containing protein [Cellulomonadaceae bacterium]
MAELSEDRLIRLISLVAYLDAAGPSTLDTLAHRFDVTPGQIRADIDLLWCTGLPGYGFDDLIDFDAWAIDAGLVKLTDAQGLTRPLRLGTREAVALLAALRALAASPAVAADPDRAEVTRSALKALAHAIDQAAGDAAQALDVALANDGNAQVLTALTAAVAGRQRLQLRYVNAADQVSERNVDPARIVTHDGATYLAAWCYRAAEPRFFRLDRILDAQVTATPADRNRVAEAENLDTVEALAGLQNSSAGNDDTGSASPDSTSPGSGDGLPVVTITFAGTARWIAETVPAVAVHDRPDGAFALTLRVVEAAWLRSLLLAQAPHIIAVEPPDAARPASDAAQEALALYGIE